MNGLDSQLVPLNNDESASSDYTLLIILTSLLSTLLTAYAMTRFAESSNRLNYESRMARIIAGFIKFMAHLLHTRSGDLEIANSENTLIAIGPHRTGWEAIVVATKIKGAPPRFFTTDTFNVIPGVASFMKMFQAITVKSDPTKADKGRSANFNALDEANKVLNERGCVALFPQGNFSKIGQEPPRVYAGVARIALKNKIPIHVIRLDGFWCFQNPLIPLFVRNHLYYRAFLSLFHMNNVRTTLCCLIDFHLKAENEHLSDEAKIEEICAQLYAYYRHTRELNPKEIACIKTEISNKTHLLIWNNKVKQDELGKQLVQLKKEEAKLEKPTLVSMANTLF